MPMTSRGVRKWKNFERAVARELRKLAPSAQRCLQFQKDHGSPDVEAGVLWVECKSGQHRPVERVYRERIGNGIPVAGAEAWGRSILKALSLSAVGEVFSRSGGPRWVQPESRVH